MKFSKKSGGMDKLKVIKILEKNLDEIFLKFLKKFSKFKNIFLNFLQDNIFGACPDYASNDTFTHL